MKISTTTADFLGNGCWAKTPSEAVSYFRETSFRHLDFDFNYIANEKDSAFYDKKGAWKKEIYDAKNEAEKGGIDFVVAHSYISHAEYQAGGEQREHTLTQLRNAIEACGMMGVHDIVIHGYFQGDNPLESNRRFFADFSDALERYDVNGLIENGGAARFLLDAIHYAKNPRMHAVWDIGHANIDRDSQYDEITLLGDELRTIHVHDNFGREHFRKLEWYECDTHMLPYTGTVNYDEILCALLDIGYKGYFNLESINILRAHNTYPWNLRRTWERETRILNMPVKVRILAEELAYQIAKAMLEAYDCFEE